MRHRSAAASEYVGLRPFNNETTTDVLLRQTRQAGSGRSKTAISPEGRRLPGRFFQTLHFLTPNDSARVPRRVPLSDACSRILRIIPSRTFCCFAHPMSLSKIFNVYITLRLVNFFLLYFIECISNCKIICKNNFTFQYHMVVLNNLLNSSQRKNILKN